MKTFWTPTTLDTRAITMLGMSSKPNTENPIGYFGTGLKYSIAVCVRNEIKIEIFSGYDCYTFFARDTKFRGQNFREIIMLDQDGKETVLPFTTEYGKNWPEAAVYRELASNTIDERGAIFSSIRPHESGTTIHIYGLEEVKHTDYFLDKSVPLEATASVEVFPGKTQSVYLRGVKVHSERLPCNYTYNLREGKLTEDRTLADKYMLQFIIGRFWASEPTFDREMFVSGAESKWDYMQEQIVSYTNDVAGLEYIVSHPNAMTSIKEKARKRLVKLKPDEGREMTEEEMCRFSKIIWKALRMVDFDQPPPIRIYSQEMSQVYGIATQGRVMLNPSLLENEREFFKTLIEELIHIKTGASDETRAMQEGFLEVIARAAGFPNEPAMKVKLTFDVGMTPIDGLPF